MHPILDAIRSAAYAIKDNGIWFGVLVFFLVLAYGYSKISGSANKTAPEKIETKKMTKEEADLEKDKRVLGYIIGALIIFGLTYWILS